MVNSSFDAIEPHLKWFVKTRRLLISLWLQRQSPIILHWICFNVDDHDFSSDAVTLCSTSPEMAKEIIPSTKVSLPHVMHMMSAEVSNVLHDWVGFMR